MSYNNNRNRGRGGGNQRGRGRGRGRGQGRGRGRGRGRGNLSFNNNRGGYNNRGGFNNRGGYNNNRGNYNNNRNNNYNNRNYNNNNRGGFGGNNQYRSNNNNYNGNRGGYNNRNYNNYNRDRYGGGNQRRPARDEVPKFSCEASDELFNVVNKNNESDKPGIQKVYVYQFRNSSWQCIESLSKGTYYYFNGLNGKKTFKKPKNINDTDGVLHYADQGLSLPKPPTPLTWNNTLPLIDNIRTNTYNVQGNITQEYIQIYIIKFEPEIPEDDVIARKRVLIGDSKNRKKIYENKRILFNYFGHWVFDNTILYSLGHKNPPNKGKAQTPFELKGLHPNYRIFCYWKDSKTFVNNKDIPIEFEEQLLNVYNRKRLENGKFIKHRNQAKWFFKHPENPPIDQLKIKKVTDEVSIITGYDCSVKILADKRGDESAYFKADIISKLVGSKTIYDMIHNMIQTEGPNHKNIITNKLKGKYFITTYSSKSLRIVDIDWNQTENSSFVLKATGGQVTFKSYYKQVYGLKALKKEYCLIKDDQGNFYVPQFCRLTLRSDDDGVKSNYDEILKHTNRDLNDRIQLSDNLVTYLNKINDDDDKKKSMDAKPKRNNNINNNNNNNNSNNKNNNDSNSDCKDDQKGNRNDSVLNIDYSFTINEPVLVKAIKIGYPNITIKTEDFQQGRKRKIDKTTSVVDLQWTGRHGTKGFLGNMQFVQSWCVVGNDFRAINKVINTWEAYLSMRNFGANFAKPNSFRVNNLLNSNEYRELERYELIVLILPNNIASEIKAKFTRFCQINNNMQLQCILSSNAFNKNAVLGMFEDMLGKLGNVLFRINPNIKVRNKNEKLINTDSLWVYGLDVSHNIGKPSTAVLILQTQPFNGSKRGIYSMAHLNKKKRQIVGYQQMTTLVFESIKNAFNDKKLINGNVKYLPKQIYIFRSGLPDNRIRESFSKEVVAFQRAIEIFNKQLIKNKKLQTKWKPKIVFIVCCLNINDRFGIINGQHSSIKYIQEPCIIYNAITSCRIWDFILYPFTQKKIKTPERVKPMRCIVLKDDIGFTTIKSINAPLQLYKFVHSLLYTYAFAIPFLTGGTTEPAPLKYASHYAETFSQLILNTDKNLRDIKINQEIKHKPQIIDRFLKTKAKAPDSVQKAIDHEKISKK